jgi:ferrous iron transport protein B
MTRSLHVVALIGTPNCGKTALFNSLTGGRQRVGNYPGVTVEKKNGQLATDAGNELTLIDLPGLYSLDAHSPDEAVAAGVLVGSYENELRPDVVLAVCDATNLERTLGLIVEVNKLGIPMVLAVNMMDLAKKRSMHLDLKALSAQLKIPVVPTSATQKTGIRELTQKIDDIITANYPTKTLNEWRHPTVAELVERNNLVRKMVAKVVTHDPLPDIWSRRIDAVALHRLWGPLLLAVILFSLFQAVFSWAEMPMTLIEEGLALLSSFITQTMGSSLLQSFLVDGIIAGVGAVIVFLPQILILFFFIYILEASGYMMRATLIMNRLMNAVGLPGQAFVPLLSSFACAIPGIMATRTIKQPRDRLITILITPLMTCSARLPVYILLIGAFIPNTRIWGSINLQGLVMTGLFIGGIVSAMLVAWGTKVISKRKNVTPFVIDLPSYKLPQLRGLMIEMSTRARSFLQRAGTIILGVSMALWVLASFPKPPADWDKPAISYSYAGRMGEAIEPLFRPIGFDYRITTGLIPGMAAREVMVGVLGTTFAIEGADDDSTGGFVSLQQKLRDAWPLATGLALLVWYIFAPQCFPTIVMVRKETMSMKWPVIMVVYMFALAYLGAFVTYQLTRLVTG